MEIKCDVSEESPYLTRVRVTTASGKTHGINVSSKSGESVAVAQAIAVAIHTHAEVRDALHAALVAEFGPDYLKRGCPESCSRTYWARCFAVMANISNVSEFTGALA